MAGLEKGYDTDLTEVAVPAPIRLHMGYGAIKAYAEDRLLAAMQAPIDPSLAAEQIAILEDCYGTSDHMGG